jgi:hypothetical protein
MNSIMRKLKTCSELLNTQRSKTIINIYISIKKHLMRGGLGYGSVSFYFNLCRTIPKNNTTVIFIFKSHANFSGVAKQH